MGANTRWDEFPQDIRPGDIIKLEARVKALEEQLGRMIGYAENTVRYWRDSYQIEAYRAEIAKAKAVLEGK